MHNSSPVISGANKEITAGALWDDDFGNDPDLYTMPYRQYDPVLGRFNAVDPMAEKYDDLTVYNFGFNNPVTFSDPSGADPIGTWEEFWNMILGIYYGPGYNHGGYWNSNNPFDWKNVQINPFGSIEEGRNHLMDNLTAWDWWGKNGTVSYEQGYSILTGSVLLDQVDINEAHSNKNWLVDRQKKAWGESVDNETVNSGWLDGLQTGLDVVGMTEIPLVSQGAELISAGISFGRGDVTGGLIGLGSMIPVGGKAFEAAKIARKIQKHHLIPNAVYKTFKKELKAVGWKQNGLRNLKKLEVPFHGNHPQLNSYVTSKIKTLQKEGNLTLDAMKKLQADLRHEINDVIKKGEFEKLNDYFRTKN